MSNPFDNEIKAEVPFINTIIKCLCDAVGDDIKKDIAQNRLKTNNSKPPRIWDFLNRNICERFDERDYIVNPIKRGPWALVPIFERNTGYIYSVMREERFKLLQKQQPKRRNAHYIDIFARSFNKDLISPQRQTPLFPDNVKLFDNEELIEEIVQKILSDLKIPNELVRRHGLILFQSFNGELSSLRCCIVDSYLELVNQANWGDFIKTSEGSIVDKVTDKTSAYSNPDKGLKFTQKAKNKIKQRPIPIERADEEKKTDESE